MNNTKNTMESNEVAVSRGLGVVRNYGIMVLFALLALNGVTLWGLHWVETNDARNELIRYAGTLPSPDINQPKQTINLPEDIIALRTKTIDRVGFYETAIGGQDYLAYADTNKQYILMKSEAPIQRETQSFTIALGSLYLGELVLMLGWWLFVRSKVREIFEIA